MPKPDQARCARCAGLEKKAAATKRQFAVEKEQYEIELCEDHARTFDRDMGAWTRVADEILPVVYAGTSDFQRARAVKNLFLPEPSPDPHVVKVQKLPPQYHLWTLTTHAKERCAERGISQRDALILASDPSFARPVPGPDGGDGDTGKWIHTRGGWHAIVDRQKKTVITVMPDELLAQRKELSVG